MWIIIPNNHNLPGRDNFERELQLWNTWQIPVVLPSTFAKRLDFPHSRFGALKVLACCEIGKLGDSSDEKDK